MGDGYGMERSDRANLDALKAQMLEELAAGHRFRLARRITRRCSRRRKVPPASSAPHFRGGAAEPGR